MVSESILKKIKALLSLSENNDSVEESASAFAKAQHLIEEYNLSMADVENAVDDEEEIDDFDADEAPSARLSSWKGQLIQSLAKNNLCKAYISSKYINGKYLKCYKLIGTPSDVQIVNYMFAYMSREIERICKVEQKRMGGQGKSWANSFKIGAVSSITDELKKAKQQAREQAATSAIVRVDDKQDAVEKWSKKLNLRKGSKSTYKKDNDAFSSGYKSGSSIHTRSGLKSGSTNERLQ